MAKQPKTPASSIATVAGEQKNVERLRALRLAHESASREAGTWGEMSVGEIVHSHTGAVFVHHWRGRDAVDLKRMAVKRPVELTIEEHKTLAAWLTQFRGDGFEQTMLGWDLSVAEARRRKAERIAALRSSGRQVINDAVAETKVPVATGTAGARARKAPRRTVAASA